MIYLTHPSTPEIRAHMARRLYLGQLTTPGKTSHRLVEGSVWAADNGCFNAAAYVGDTRWLRWLNKFTPTQRATCLFAVAPDVVGDHEATWQRSRPYLQQIRALGYPAALVAQDGIESSTWDAWDEIDALFIGGTTTFKLSAAAAGIAREATARGKWLHMGRVNSYKRLAYAAAVGCQSVDGTYIAFAPDANVQRTLGWFKRLEAGSCQGTLFTDHDLWGGTSALQAAS